MSQYSANRLKNAYALEGLNDWTTEGVQVIKGGTTGGYCFALDPIAKMTQSVPVPGQPTDYKVRARFLPLEDVNDEDPDVKTWIEVLYMFGDGSTDIIRLPCKGQL